MIRMTETTTTGIKGLEFERDAARSIAAVWRERGYRARVIERTVSALGHSIPVWVVVVTGRKGAA